jgi:signal transduction histidine kinase
MNAHHLIFDEETLNRLFPFYIIVNKDSIVEACGRSMKKLNTGCVGKPIDQAFELVRPKEGSMSFSMLLKLTNQLVVLKTRDKGDDNALILGQFEYFSQVDKLLLAGTPWLNSIEELKTHQLVLSDFAHNDHVLDILHALKDQEIINNDLKKLVSKINQQKNELKNKEEQILAALNKEKELSNLKSSFVTLASHEFRTPLACIRSSIELMQFQLAKIKVSDNILRHQNNIVVEVDRLSELLNGILIVGKIESNLFECNKEPIDLEYFINRILYNLTYGKVDKRPVAIEISGAKEKVMADPVLLEQILTNLLSNAFKFSQGKTPPQIRISYAPALLQIKVKDFGIGIPYDDKSKIFNAFHRAENAGNIQGTGLGLFITKSFIDLHEGTISFTSIAERGSEFTVSLPK